MFDGTVLATIVANAMLNKLLLQLLVALHGAHLGTMLVGPTARCAPRRTAIEGTEMKLLGRKLFYVAPPPITHVLVTNTWHKNPKTCVGHFTSREAAEQARDEKKRPGKFQIEEARHHHHDVWVTVCKVGGKV